MNLEARRIVYTSVYFVAVVLSGTMLLVWLDVKPLVSVPLLIWVVAWSTEYHMFNMSFPCYRRDWIAHIGGLCSSLVGLVLWIVLKNNYVFLLDKAFQLVYVLFVMLVQDSVIYLVSSQEYRKVALRLYSIPSSKRENTS